MRGLHFTKGHGTENDFVLVADLDGTRDLTVDEVRLLADRRAGLGGDGVIRVVPTARASEALVREQAGQAAWFMDYRNADGSAAEMCGNGTRVFAAYLRREGLETADEFAIATRAGVTTVVVTGGQYAVDLGNPHTVVILPRDIDLDALDLTEAPAVSPTPAHGTNVEFVRAIAQGHIAMRVHERGVGETRSCGTGAAAAALATRWWEGESDDNTEWTVDVPGGRLSVRALPDQHVELAGPAILVADGTVELSSPPR